MKVDICSVCHPFYTGKLKYVNTAGRIEKFQRKFSNTGYASLQRGKKKAAEARPQRKRPDEAKRVARPVPEQGGRVQAPSTG